MPVFALDLCAQATIPDLLLEVQEATDVAYLFISDDLEVVRHLSNEVVVMYKGEIVESGDALAITEHPQHACTQRLLMLAHP